MRARGMPTTGVWNDGGWVWHGAVNCELATKDQGVNDFPVLDQSGKHVVKNMMKMNLALLVRRRATLSR
jgi:hypothetical protein